MPIFPQEHCGLDPILLFVLCQSNNIQLFIGLHSTGYIQIFCIATQILLILILQNIWMARNLKLMENENISNLNGRIMQSLSILIGYYL